MADLRDHELYHRLKLNFIRIYNNSLCELYNQFRSEVH
jgi:hypothetical protein